MSDEREQTQPSVRVDDSDLYDLFMSLNAIATPAHYERWREWSTAARDAYSQQELRRLRRWFGGKFPLGAAFITLIPLLDAPASADTLLGAIAALPLGDFLRIIVTAEYVNPETPLDAETLLGLSRDAIAAEEFLGRYLSFSGRTRTDVLRVLADPEGARADLLALLRRQLALPRFAALMAETRAERAQALDALRRLVASGAELLPLSLTSGTGTEGFTQVIYAVSVVLGTGWINYIQEIARPLLDGTNYEPLMHIRGTQSVLEGPTANRRGVDAGTSTLPRDPVERAAHLFGLLGDPSRLRLLRLLTERPHFGQELAAALGVSAASVSQQIGLLARAGLVRTERRAHRTYYALQPDALAAVFETGQALLRTDPREQAHQSGKDRVE